MSQIVMTEHDMKINFNQNLVIWIIVSIILAIIFARNSGGMCEYLFLTFSYLFIIYIITSVWRRFEFEPSEQAMITAAAIGGWFFGTFIIWRSRGQNRFFSETC